MGVIVCAVRGGLDSRATISSAITLAKETNSVVVFLFVINQDLVQSVSGDQAHTIAERMRRMGQSVLLTAQALANSQGVSARSIVRHGDVADEIARTCREFDVEHLVLSPAGSQQGQGHSTLSLLAQFVAQLQQNSEINVILSE